MGRPRKKVSSVEEYGLFRCTSCGEEWDTPINHFFRTSSSLYAANDKYFPVCKKCLQQKFEEYTRRFDEKEATKMGQNARNTVLKHYNQPIITAKYIEFYKEISSV